MIRGARLVAVVICVLSAIGCSKAVPEIVSLSSFVETLQFSLPPSPSSNATPSVSVIGAGAGSAVEIFLSSDCSGAAAGSAVTDQTGAATVSVAISNDGTHALSGKSAAGCVSIGDYRLDRVAPKISGVVDDLVPQRTKTFAWSCDEDCSYRWSIDQLPGSLPGGAWGATGAASQLFGTGTYYLHVEAIDAAGNSSFAHAQFELDNTPPSPSLSYQTPASSPSNNDAPTFFVSNVEAGDSIQLFLDSACTVAVASGISGASSMSLGVPAFSSDGAYKVFVQATDALGNSSGCDGALDYELDRVAPTVTNLVGGTTPVSTMDWSWSCNENCTFRFKIDTDPNGDPSSEPFTSATDFSQNWGTGTYYLHVQAQDEAGNISAIAHASAVLDNSPLSPKLALAAGVISPSASVATPTLLATDLKDGASVEFWLYGCGGTSLGAVTADATGELTFTPPAQSSSTFYSYYMQTLNADDNPVCVGPVEYLYDIDPPSAPSPIEDGFATGLLTQTPVIEFLSPWDASAIAGYEIRVIRTMDSAEMIGWQSIVSGNFVSGLTLEDGQTYHVEVRAIDGVGNVSLPAVSDGFFVDTTPPTVPGTPSLGAVPNFLNRTPPLSFSASTDSESGILYYEVQVYRASDDAIVVPWSKLVGGEGTSHEWTGFMLENLGEYYVKVRAVNGGKIPSGASGASPTWIVGCSSTTIPVDGSIAASEAEGHYCFQVPANVTTLNVKVWGAGGGGSVSHGGGGGFITGVVPVTPGELLLVTVGSGGQKGDATVGGAPGYGGGGRGNPRMNSYKFGSGGGGYTAIFRGPTPLLVAGGGGGGQGDVNGQNAGPGGGFEGGDDEDVTGAKGGTQTAGGAGAGGCGQPGSAFRGGDAGIQNDQWGGGGGGGGGYFGGGGGCRGNTGSSKSTSGGGGSSYADVTVSSVATTSGSGRDPGELADADRVSGGAPANVGFGGSGDNNLNVSGNDGGPGHIHISW